MPQTGSELNHTSASSIKMYTLCLPVSVSIILHASIPDAMALEITLVGNPKRIAVALILNLLPAIRHSFSLKSNMKHLINMPNKETLYTVLIKISFISNRISKNMEELSYSTERFTSHRQPMKGITYLMKLSHFFTQFIVVMGFLASGGTFWAVSRGIYKVATRIESAVGVDKDGKTLSDRMKKVEIQLWPNGGSSLADRMARVETTTVSNASELTLIKDLLVILVDHSGEDKK